MTVIITILCLILLVIVIIQIGKVSELAGRIRGEQDVQLESNYWNSRLGMVFMVLFLLATIVSAVYYKNFMLGYGPHEAASEHGGLLDRMFDITLFFTGIVFVLTHIALFWFAYKYRQREGHKAEFMPHDNRLEVVWTAIPAVVMTILVVFGLNAWNEVMSDVDENEEYIEIEATGMQFAWIVRYPGPDGELGDKYFRNISGVNPLGQIWEDEANLDDFHASEIVLPVDKKVRVKITARDVLHNFYLPHFRVKMDAVPGMPTYFIFTPTKTTAEYREELSKYPEYQQPADPQDPEGPQLWENFTYELACAELCGQGHFSMRMPVRIVEEEEYQEWFGQQNSYYQSAIAGTDADPYKGIPTDSAIGQDTRMEEIRDMFRGAIETDGTDDDVVSLEYAYFSTGTDELLATTEVELDLIAGMLKENSEIGIEISQYVPGSGDEDVDMDLSQRRAQRIMDYLVEQGISPDRIVATGYGSRDAEGEVVEERLEFRIIK